MATSTPRILTGNRHLGVLDSLGERVASGKLPAGEILTLEEISVDYAVSRPVAREAVRVLESLGMISSRRRVGLTIQPQEKWNLFHPSVIAWRLEGDDRRNQLLSLSELRLGFEPAAAALAAERASTEQSVVMIHSVEMMRVHAATRDLNAYLQADAVFHTTLLEASRNEMFASMAGMVGAVLSGRTHHQMMPSPPNPVALDLHEQVALAVRDGDRESAQRSMRAIIEESAQAMAAEQAD